MADSELGQETRLALVADVGRTTVRIGLTDDAGNLRPETVRDYDPTTHTTLSSAITAFGRESGLRRLPRRCAIAVSGVPRGDTMSITNSRWILSKSGIGAMLQAEPLIINDFAANAWAMSARGCSGRIEPIAGQPVRPHDPGVYSIIGVGSGLGVAILSRDEHGLVSVIPTEGGHSHFVAAMPGLAPVAEMIGGPKNYVTAEMLLSGPGLLALYKAVGQRRGKSVQGDLDKLLSPAARHDPVAVEAIDLFARALWFFAGNMVLAHGAWDGVMLTGSVAAALKHALRRLDVIDSFALAGPFSRRLVDVPRSMISFRHAELEGAAVALLVEDERRAMTARPFQVAA